MRAKVRPLGPLMIDIEGFELNPQEKEILQHPAVGGVILFARNYHDVAQVTALCQAIRGLRDPHLLIAVDQEGGRVQRFKQGFTILPSLGQLARHNDQALIESAGWLMATEVLAVGVDISFAPVLDLNLGISTVIGDRSFSDDPYRVAELGAAYLRGLRAAGMAGTGKHFPGHGSVAADSHHAIPVDDRSFDEILNLDWIPFEKLANDLAGIMPAHVIYPKVDALPAGFSKVWLEKLRNRLHFDGLIFSDDLSMHGASCVGDHIERARVAFAAGCDMALVCNDPKNAVRVMESLEHHVPSSLLQQRIQRMYGQPQPVDAQRLKAVKNKMAEIIG